MRSCCFFCASLGSFLASFFSVVAAAFLSSVFALSVCAIASGDTASIRLHSAAITVFMSTASSNWLIFLGLE
jgi:hypothetical protein